MSFFKYFNETHDSDGQRLWWPGGPEGFPFKGSTPPQTTDDEYQQLKPSLSAKCRLFYLHKPEDLSDYTIIRDKCANGYFIQLDRERTWDDETKNYRIYLEWAEPAYVLPTPTGVKDAIKQHITEAEQSITVPYARLAGLNLKNGW